MYVITFRAPLSCILYLKSRLFSRIDCYHTDAGGVSAVLYRFRPSALGISALLVYDHVKSFQHVA